jgi:glycosyltransferase involved in cell wall biosynthesis
MSDPLRASICSPIHNEEGNVAELIERVHAVMTPRFGAAWEQLLVDDGSSDRSAEIIRLAQRERPTLRLLQHPHNRGERAAWKTAFDNARGEVVALLAGDLQSPPEELPKLLDEVLVRGFDVGTGRRAGRKDGVYYWTATRVLNAYSRLVFDVPVSDVSSSFFAVRRRFVEALPIEKNDHRYILAVLRRRAARISEVDTEHAARSRGRSHYSRWKVLKAVPELLEFTQRWRRGAFDGPPL